MSKIYCDSCGFLQPAGVLASGPASACSECGARLHLPKVTALPPTVTPPPIGFADEPVPLTAEAIDFLAVPDSPPPDAASVAVAPPRLAALPRAEPVPAKSAGPSMVAAAAGAAAVLVVGSGLLVAGWLALRPGEPVADATTTNTPVAVASPVPTPQPRATALKSVEKTEGRLAELRAGDEVAKLRGLRQLAGDAPAGAGDLLAQAATELSHESAAVRAAALAALRVNDGAQPPPELRLRVALFGAKPEATLYAAEGYGRTAAPAEAVGRLGKLAGDESAGATGLRRAVVAALANCDPAARLQACGQLADRLDDPDAGVRAAALAAMRRGPLAPAERALLTDRLHAASALRGFKTAGARVSVATLLKDDSAEPLQVLAALRPALAAAEAPEVRAVALDAVLASPATVRLCAEGDGGPTLLGLLVRESPAPYEPSPAARRRIVAALVALAPPPAGLARSLATALDRDPDEEVRADAAKFLCAAPVGPTGSLTLARKLLASPKLGPADKSQVLDALAALPAGDKSKAELLTAWPELWELVEGATRQPLAAEVALKSLDLLDGLTDRRPGAADAAKTKGIVATLVEVAFGRLEADGPPYGDKVHAAAVRVLKHFPGPAVELLAERAAKSDDAASAGRVYSALIDLAAAGPQRDLVVNVLDTQALPRAKLDAAFRPAAGAAAARAGGDRLALRLFTWTERNDRTTNTLLAPELRVWAVESLGAMDPATLSQSTREKVAKQFFFLETYGTTEAIKSSAAAAGEAFKRKSKK